MLTRFYKSTLQSASKFSRTKRVVTEGISQVRYVLEKDDFDDVCNNTRRSSFLPATVYSLAELGAFQDPPLKGKSLHIQDK